jgi:PAS domain S-box-containing protein
MPASSSQRLPDAPLPRRQSGEEGPSATELADTPPDVIWIYSDDLRDLFYVNAAYERVWGYPAKALHQAPLAWINAIHPEDRQKALAVLQTQDDAACDQVTPPVELRVLVADGALRWTRLQVCRLRGADGQSAAYRCVVAHDTTLYKRMQETLRYQQREQETILDSVPAMIFYKDTENHFLRVNRALAEAVGLPRSAIEGHSVSELFPDHANAYWQDDREVVASGRSKWDILEPICTSTGLRWWQTSKIPYKDDSGRIVGVVGFSLDVTERKLAEDALRRRDAILEAVSFASQRLLTTTAWNAEIREVLARLGGAAELSRVRLFENHLSPEGELLASQRYEWVAPEDSRVATSPELLEFSYRESGFHRWPSRLARGEVIHGLVRDLDADEREALAMQGIQSVIVVPIFKGGEWWGLVEFDDCVTMRQWSYAEREALRAAAGTLGAAIQRAQAEVERYRLHQSLQAVIDNASVWLTMVDNRGGIVAWNRAAEQISGYSRGELQRGWNIWEKLYPDKTYRQELLYAVRQARCQGMGLDDQVARIRRKDGQERIISWTIRFLQDAQGGYAGMLILGQDITERRRADEALRLSNYKLSLLADSATRLVGLAPVEDGYQFVADRFRELADGMMVHIATYDTENHVLTARAFSASTSTWQILNSAVEYQLIPAQYQLPPRVYEEMKKRQLLPVGGVYNMALGRISPEDAAALEQKLGAGEIWGIGLAQDDQLLGAVTIMLPAGQHLAMPHIIETFAYQVTIWLRRQQIERDLRESEARFRSLFQNIGDAFVLLDEQLRVVDINELADCLLGLGPDALGRPFVEVCSVLAPNGTDLTALLEDVLQSGGAQQNVEMYRQCAGDEEPARNIYLAVTIYRAYVEGEPRVALLCRDISEKRRLEEETERARRLEALARLAFGVAHDFGNFLAIIRGEAEFMGARAMQEAEREEHLETILRVVEDATSLSRELLAFSRGETVKPEILHLNVLITRNQAALRRLLGDDITLTLELSSKPIFFWGDKGQFGRVLVNLVSNARDAMPGGGTLTISTRLEELEGIAAERLNLMPGLYAVMVVRDTGEGIDQEAMRSIFDPFFTTRTKDKRSGLGMGLSVVYGIMQQHAGQVSVLSQPGQGTTFYLYFPAVVVEDWMLDEGEVPPPPKE